MTSSLRLPWHHVYSRIFGSWPLPHTHSAWSPSIVCWTGLRPSLCPSPPTACVQGKWQTSSSAKIQIYKDPWFICLIPEHNWQYCTSTRMRTTRKRSLLMDCLSGRSRIRNQKREWLLPVPSKLAPRTVSGLLSVVTNLDFRVQESISSERMFCSNDLILTKVLSVSDMLHGENVLSCTIPVHLFNFRLCQPAAERNDKLLQNVAIVQGSFRSKPLHRPPHPWATPSQGLRRTSWLQQGGLGSPNPRRAPHCRSGGCSSISLAYWCW